MAFAVEWDYGKIKASSAVLGGFLPLNGAGLILETERILFCWGLHVIGQFGFHGENTSFSVLRLN